MYEVTKTGQAGRDITCPMINIVFVNHATTVVALSELGDYVGGSSASAHFQSIARGLSSHHFTIEHGSSYCLLKPIDDVFLNDRRLMFPVQLANGDVFKAGEAVFRYVCPQNQNFPLLRVADTFWVLKQVPEGWGFSVETGIYRYLDNVFVENISCNQDEIKSGTLQQYVDGQLSLIAHATVNFSTELLPTKCLYQSEEYALYNHIYTFQNRKIHQYQYFIRKNNTIGIASWTTPRQQAKDKHAVYRFHDLLQNIIFG